MCVRSTPKRFGSIQVDVPLFGICDSIARNDCPEGPSAPNPNQTPYPLSNEAARTGLTAARGRGIQSPSPWVMPIGWWYCSHARLALPFRKRRPRVAARSHEDPMPENGSSTPAEPGLVSRDGVPARGQRPCNAKSTSTRYGKFPEFGVTHSERLGSRTSLPRNMIPPYNQQRLHLVRVEMDLTPGTGPRVDLRLRGGKRWTMHRQDRCG